MNAHAVKQNYKMKLYVHEMERDYLSQGKSPVIRGTNPVLKAITLTLQKPMQSIAHYDPVEPDIIVGQEELSMESLGINACLLHTPGHSVGSISAIVDNEIAIVGDAMFGIFPNSVYPPFAADTKLLVNSWGKLIDTGCRLFLPSHGEVRTLATVLKQYGSLTNDQ
jgi:glyoxylase-like metal-dependent hydrolase (beta-lactamase superfamily II)